MNKSKIRQFLNSLKLITTLFVVCFIIPFFSFFIYNKILNKFSIFEEGYSVCGVDLSNLDGEQAEQKLRQFEQENNNEIKLTLRYNQKQWIFDSKDFEVNSNIHIILDELQKSYRKRSKRRNS